MDSSEALIAQEKCWNSYFTKEISIDSKDTTIVRIQPKVAAILNRGHPYIKWPSGTYNFYLVLWKILTFLTSISFKLSTIAIMYFCGQQLLVKMVYPWFCAAIPVVIKEQLIANFFGSTCTCQVHCTTQTFLQLWDFVHNTFDNPAWQSNSIQQSTIGEKCYNTCQDQ